MNKIIQSLSIEIPNNGCVNDCKFCISKRKDTFISDSKTEIDIEVLKYSRRFTDTVILTGQSEPLQNPKFIREFNEKNKRLKTPFKNIEIQTSGFQLNKQIYFLLEMGVNTISLSISSLNSIINQKINQTKEYFNIYETVKNIKNTYGKPKIRLSLNLNKIGFPNTNYIKILKDIYNNFEGMVDEVTFRELYLTGNEEKDNWINENKLSLKDIGIDSSINNNLEFKGLLNNGLSQYQYKNISVVIDDDCMSKKRKDIIRYLILRKDGNLYTKWDDKKSIIRGDFMKELSINKNDMVKKLNELLEIDRESISKLFNNHVECNDELSDTDNIQVKCYGINYEQTNKCSVGLLGILNYLIDNTNKGKIFVSLRENGIIDKFFTTDTLK